MKPTRNGSITVGDEQEPYNDSIEAYEDMKAQRDVLLAALKLYFSAPERFNKAASDAIAKAEGA